MGSQLGLGSLWLLALGISLKSSDSWGAAPVCAEHWCSNSSLSLLLLQIQTMKLPLSFSFICVMGVFYIDVFLLKSSCTQKEVGVFHGTWHI